LQLKSRRQGLVSGVGNLEHHCLTGFAAFAAITICLRFGPGSLQLAWFEGAIRGVALGVLVGVPTFYAILHGRASWKEWAILIGVTFVTATV
jgi:hypothetical protein